jgi:putative FmdB family regulatory protein
MPIYEYQCGRCGTVFEKTLPMSQSAGQRRCTCGGLGRRIPSLPRLWTDTNLSQQVRDSYAVAGHPVESWNDVKRLEKDGTCVLANQHDFDTAERGRKSEFRRMMRVAREKVCDESIRIPSKPKRRKAKVA